MNRQLFVLFTLTAVLVSMPMHAARADHGHGRGHGSRGHGIGHSRGHGIGHSRGHGFGRGFGFNAFVDDGWDLAELYRELLNNVPYFALHPPVYYSYPVPRTYGYSPFAYPPYIMTPEVVGEPKAVEIVNPYVPQKKSAGGETDRSAGTAAQPQPLVVINPFVSPSRSVAQQ